MNYVFQSFNKMAGYQLVHMDSIRNYMIYLINQIPEDRQEAAFTQMKLDIGLTFHGDFKYYASRKGIKYD